MCKIANFDRWAILAVSERSKLENQGFLKLPA